MKDFLLEVEALKVSFPNLDKRINVIDGVSFHVDEREIVGLVGESGSGKSDLPVTSIVRSR